LYGSGFPNLQTPDSRNLHARDFCNMHATVFCNLDDCCFCKLCAPFFHNLYNRAVETCSLRFWVAFALFDFVSWTKVLSTKLNEASLFKVIKIFAKTITEDSLLLSIIFQKSTLISICGRLFFYFFFRNSRFFAFEFFSRKIHKSCSNVSRFRSGLAKL